MKLLTFNDFIFCNHPCKSCDGSATILLKLYPNQFPLDQGHTISLNKTVEGFLNAQPNIELIFPMFITYALSYELVINPITNEFYFKSNNLEGPEPFNYLKDYKLFVELYCKKCFTGLTSKKIEFKEYLISPLEISHEYINFKDKNKSYHITTMNEQSEFKFINEKGFVSYLKLEHISLQDIKNNKELAQKINMITTFI